MKHRIVQVQHPSYSPDLQLCNFFSFLQPKIKHEGRETILEYLLLKSIIQDVYDKFPDFFRIGI